MLTIVTAEKLDYRWIGLRGPRENFVSVTKNGLQINPFATNIKEVKPTSTLFLRQQHSNFSYAVTIDYKPGSEKDLAGITALQSENFNYVFGITKKGEDYYILLERNEKQRKRDAVLESKIMASAKIDLKKPCKVESGSQRR